MATALLLATGLLALLVLYLLRVPLLVSFGDSWAFMVENAETFSAIASLTTLLAVIVTAVIAYNSFQEDRRRAQRNNSFEHIAIHTRDHDIINMFQEFVELRREFYKDVEVGDEGPWNLVQYDRVINGPKVGDPKKKGAYIEAQDIVRKVFNYYEATAIGIKNGALDESIIKDWWRTTMVFDWYDYCLFIRKKREVDKIPKLYCELENLVDRWATEEEKKRFEIGPNGN